MQTQHAEVDTFHGQFSLTNGSKDTPPEFRNAVYGKWHLHTHKALPIHRVLNGDRNQIGFVLGFPIKAGKLLSEPCDITACADSQITDDEIETLLEQLSGRYLIILFMGHSAGPVIYPDPFCSLSTVYSAQHQMVASTTSLLHYESSSIPSYPIRSYPDVGFFYYPAGLTDFHDCQRLLPNHCLDLSNWQAARFWPKAPIEPCSEPDKDQYIERATAAIQGNMIATAVKKNIYGGLTAGFDSRVMLACTPEEIRRRTTYITFNYPDKVDKYRDVHIARVLAKTHGLKHEVLNVTEAAEEVRGRYFYRIGRSGSTNKSRDFYQAPLKNLEMNSVWLTGFGGEVAIMYYVKDKDRHERLTAAELLHRLHLPQESVFIEAIERWLDNLPDGIANELAVELFYLENRVGAWACPHLYGAAPFAVNLIPFSDRRFIKACYRLPYEFRRSRASQRRMIELADSKLLNTPFEVLTGWALRRRRLTRNRLFDLSRLRK